MNQDMLIGYIAELQSIAQAGLFYGKDVYDLERYGRIREIAAEMMAEKSALPLETVRTVFCSDYGYQTPKVDTRAAIFKDDKILLVHENNGTWSLPGGWCEFNLSPADNTIKEVREEAGLDVSVRSLIAAQNRDNHNAPRYAYAVVKLFYLCDVLGGTFRPNSETTETAYFPEDALPRLATEKCNEEQVRMCFCALRDPLWRAQFD